MIKSYQVRRHQAAFGSVKISQNSQLSINCTSSVCILEPVLPSKDAVQLISNTTVLDPAKLYRPSVFITPSSPPLRLLNLINSSHEISNISKTITNVQITSINWSSTFDCKTYLGINTNTYEMILYAKSGDGRYELKHVILDYLLAENEIDLSQVSKTDPTYTISKEILQKVTIANSCFSQDFDFGSYLCLTLSDGSFSIYMLGDQLVKVTTSKLKKPKLVLSAWSPWQKNDDDSYCSYIVFASSSNEVYLQKVIYFTSSAQISLSKLELLQPQSRFLVNKFNWSLSEGTFFLSVACVGLLHLYTVFEDGSNKAYRVPLSSYLFVFDIIHIHATRLRIYISNEEKVTSFTFDKQLFQEDTNEVQKFFDLKNKQHNTQNDVSLKIRSMNLNKFDNVVHVCYSTTMQSPYVYTIESGTSFYLGWIPISQSASVEKYHNCTSLSWINQNMVTTFKSAKIPEAIDDLGPIIKKDTFKELIIANLIKNRKLHELHISNTSLEKARKLVLTHIHNIISCYTQDKECSVDRFIRDSYKSVTTSVETESTISIENNVTTQSFDSNQPDMSVIHSSQGLSWARCGVSLLPLVNLRNKICPTCNFRIGIYTDLNIDEGGIADTLLNLKVCVYCGDNVFN